MRLLRQCAYNCFAICLFIIFHIMTSNRPLTSWGEIFGDAAVAAAVIDRLVHHAEILSAQKQETCRVNWQTHSSDVSILTQFRQSRVKIQLPISGQYSTAIDTQPRLDQEGCLPG